MLPWRRLWRIPGLAEANDRVRRGAGFPLRAEGSLQTLTGVLTSSVIEAEHFGTNRPELIADLKKWTFRYRQRRLALPWPFRDTAMMWPRTN